MGGFGNLSRKVVSFSLYKFERNKFKSFIRF